MKYQNILVPYDGSEHSKSAFCAACDLARGSETAMVHVVNVVPMTLTPDIALTSPETGAASSFVDSAYADAFDQALVNIQNEMEEDLKNFLDGLPETQVEYEAIAYPSPVNGIADYAKDNECDLIVMGRRGLGAIRGMLGSVSYGILRSIDIPVLTVK